MNIVHLVLILAALALAFFGTITWMFAAIVIVAVILFGNLLLDAVGLSVPTIFRFPFTDLFTEATLPASVQKVRSGASASATTAVTKMAVRSMACSCSN
jgi:hypothetical protein